MATRAPVVEHDVEAPTSWARELREDPTGFVAARPQVVLIPLVLVAFVGLWEWGVLRFHVPPYIAPAPSAVFASLRAGLAVPSAPGEAGDVRVWEVTSR